MDHILNKGWNGISLWSLTVVGSFAFQSCTKAPIGLTESLALIEQVEQTPSRAENICPTLPTEDLQNQCWLTTPIPTDVDQANQRCNHLTNTPRSECFFNMAEKHNQVQFCEQAGPFEWDCRTHILQQNCGRYSQAQALVKYTTSLQLNVGNMGVAGLIHRCLFFGKSQFNITLCKTLPHPDRCRDWVTALYKEKISTSLNCETRTSKLKTFGDEDLEKLREEAFKTHCPSQE